MGQIGQSPNGDAPVRAWIYCRQSDSKGYGDDSLSFEAQDLACRDYCRLRGHAVVGVDRDPDIRGWEEPAKRPGLSHVLDAAKAGRFDVLVVYEGRRLS